MPLAILASLMRPQKHSCPILSWSASAFKRVGLHYIGFCQSQRCNQNTCQPHPSKNGRINGRRDELGLGARFLLFRNGSGENRASSPSHISAVSENAAVDGHVV